MKSRRSIWKDILDEILTAHPDAEFVQLQLNYVDWENPDVNGIKSIPCTACHYCTAGNIQNGKKQRKGK